MKKTDQALARLAKKLIGRWELSGDATGTVCFGWLEQNLFLKQEFDITVFNRRIQGLEIIGRLRLPGQKPSKDIWSRAYIFSEGQTFDYVYELLGNVIRIYLGGKNSSNNFRGRFDSKGDSYQGGWSWPGGGYKLKARKIPATKPLHKIARQSRSGPMHS
jgi:hypothetical protein